MFLNLLQPDQQVAFVHAARAVAERDGEVSEVESALLDAVRAECGLDELPAPHPELDVCARAAEVLPDDVARRVFLLELAGVALIDGDAHPSELALVGEVADALGISGAALADMLAFAARAQQLVVDGQRIVATGASA